MCTHEKQATPNGAAATSARCDRARCCRQIFMSLSSRMRQSRDALAAQYDELSPRCCSSRVVNVASVNLTPRFGGLAQTADALLQRSIYTYVCILLIPRPVVCLTSKE